MTLLNRLASMLRWIVSRNRSEIDLNDELQAFVDMAAADQVRDGATAAEARRRALTQLGGVEQVKVQVRTSRHDAWLDWIEQDVRHALRQIRRNPAFAAVAIATLALGIGVNTAMFSAVDAVLIRPLPYADGGRLVMVWDDNSRVGDSKHFFSTPPEWYEWRRHNTVFTDIAATQPGDAALSGDGEPEDLPARKVTGNFWNVLGSAPLLGRVFTEDEDARGDRLAVISYGLWQRRFGASPEAVGRTIMLNDKPYEIVGVMPREFYFMPARDIDVWMPTSFPPQIFDASDRHSDAPAAIVNDTFAHRHFPGRTPLGQRLQSGNLGSKGYWYTIVGVVREIRDRGVAEELRPTIYRVHAQADQSGDLPSGIVIRTTGDPASMVAAVRQAIWTIDKNQPVARIQTIDDIVARQLSVPSQNTVLLSAFAILALLLAAIGLYGVLSYSVTVRTKEIGVRKALGADPMTVLISFSKSGVVLALAGLAIGVGVAMVAARAMRTLFYDAHPDHIYAIAGASIALLVVAALGSIVPAYRASRIDPVIALQQE